MQISCIWTHHQYWDNSVGHLRVIHAHQDRLFRHNHQALMASPWISESYFPRFLLITGALVAPCLSEFPLDPAKEHDCLHHPRGSGREGSELSCSNFGPSIEELRLFCASWFWDGITSLPWRNFLDYILTRKRTMKAFFQALKPHFKSVWILMPSDVKHDVQ